MQERGYSGKMRNVFTADGRFSHLETFNRATGEWQRVYKAEDMLMYDADGNLPPSGDDAETRKTL